MSAARSSPGSISGSPSSATRGDAQPRLRISWLSMPRVCAALPRVHRAPSAAPRGPRAYRCRARATGPQRPRGWSRRLGDRRVPLDSCRDRTTGPASPAASAAARSFRCRGGRGRSAPSGRRPAARSARRARPGRAAGSRPGTSSTRSTPASSAARMPRRGRLVVPLVVVIEDDRAVAAGDLLSAAVGADDEDPSIERVRRRATSTSENIASASARAAPARAPARDAAWRRRSS